VAFATRVSMALHPVSLLTIERRAVWRDRRIVGARGPPPQVADTEENARNDLDARVAELAEQLVPLARHIQAVQDQARASSCSGQPTRWPMEST